MKKILKWVLKIFIIIIFIIVYARFIGTMGLITKEYKIVDKNIPDDFDGLKVVHFSDIHYNRAITIKKVNNIVKEINKINPDIVVFTGDLIDKDATLNDNDYEELMKAFKNIKAKYGKYSILGNHDEGKEKDKILKLYKDSDFIYLENDNDIIYSKNNQEIFIGGLNTSTFNKQDIEKTINVDSKEDIKYKIILTHEPDIASEIIKASKVNLILAGHSHNGQVRLPFIGAIYKPPHAKKYYDEHYNLSGTQLYISSGIGVSTINYRLFNHPSINFYRINKD